MEIKRRNLFFVFIMQFVTFGIYSIYWAFETKDEIESLGASIPSAILSIIPIVNVYFWYKYLVAFNQYVKKGSLGFLIFLFLFFPFSLGMLIVQDGLNDIAARNRV